MLAGKLVGNSRTHNTESSDNSDTPDDFLGNRLHEKRKKGFKEVLKKDGERGG